jgi:hypothetical protein
MPAGRWCVVVDQCGVDGSRASEGAPRAIETDSDYRVSKAPCASRGRRRKKQCRCRMWPLTTSRRVIDRNLTIHPRRGRARGTTRAELGRGNCLDEENVAPTGCRALAPCALSWQATRATRRDMETCDETRHHEVPHWRFHVRRWRGVRHLPNAALCGFSLKCLAHAGQDPPTAVEDVSSHALLDQACRASRSRRQRKPCFRLRAISSRIERSW